MMFKKGGRTVAKRPDNKYPTISDQGSSDGCTGEAYTWDGFKLGEPQCISAIIGSASVKTVSLGGHHSALLTVDGRLFMYGSNDRGQLGVGSSSTAFISAQNMQLVLAEEFVADISCGRNHTACITGNGLVYCWGENSDNQCGVPQATCLSNPQHVQIVTRSAKRTSACLSSEIETHIASGVAELPACDDHEQACDATNRMTASDWCVSVKMSKIACGMTHTMALSDDGCLWTWGTGCQLGLGDCTVASSPRCVEFPVDRRVIGVSCGVQHTVALVVRRGENDILERSLSNSFMEKRFGEKGCKRRAVANDFYTCQKNDYDQTSVESEIEMNVALTQTQDSDRHTLANSEHTDGSIICSATHSKQQQNQLNRYAAGIELKVLNTSNTDQSLVGMFSAGCSVSSVSSILAESSLTVSENLSSDGRSVLTVNDAHTSEFADKSNYVSCQQVAPCESSSTPEESSSAAHERLQLTLAAAVPKSRSSFLDETQAKEFLQRQLSDIDSSTAATGTDSRSITSSKEEQAVLEKKDSVDSVPSAGPFARTVGTLWQHVPSSPVVVQEYVTNLTRSVVSNLRTSMDRRFNFVTNQVEMSLSGLASLGKVPISDVGDPGASSDDVELLGRLANNTASTTTVSKSSTMDFEPTRFTHHRNGSLPIGTIELLRNEFHTSKLYDKVHLETEVWSWGCGAKGQLGHADFLDRYLPCQVASLDDYHIVKVIAGGEHTVAVSASCQVFTWGDNSCGQLGHSHPGTSTPYMISVYGRMPIWDIAAGDQHTVILCDGLNTDPHVYFCGSDRPSQNNVLQLSRFPKLKGLGLVLRIYAGGYGQSACVISSSSSMMNATFEMAASERLFHMSLDKIDQLFMQPLMQLEIASKSCDSQRSLQPLACELKLISQLSAESHLHLTNILRDIPSCNLANILHTYLLRDTNGRLSAFQRYAKTFADSCVCAAFDNCVKTNRGFFDKVKTEFKEILEESKIDVNNYEYTFQNLLQLPLQRPREYHKILSKISQLYPAYGQEHARLNKLAQTWQTLKQKISFDHELMEKTIGYWRTASPKIVEALQIAERRLLRDSRPHPLLLSTAGRFSSSHVFLLFNDCFVHIQYSGHQVYSLCTVWVEIVPDSKQLKKQRTLRDSSYMMLLAMTASCDSCIQNAILMSMPEDFITLTTPSHSDKAEWIWCLNQTIARALVDGKTAASLVEVLNGNASNVSSNCSAVVPLSPPRDRHFSYTFTKAGPLKDAQYKGMWRSSKIHGHGELVWPDGRRYCGQFVDGQFEGYGVYTQPTDDLGVEISEGMWKSGLLHGWARVRYSNGDVYKGEFVDGKKHGHGVLKQGKFTASLANIYIGQWQADKRHGYGVCDDIPKGQKYMGMWMDDNRHGNGIIVTLDGLYFEGNFVNGKITGQGLLITEDNCCYEGEFAGGPNLSGKGLLTLPNGDYIEGLFNGSFTEGIKINGTYRRAVIDHASSNSKLASTFSSAAALPNRYGQLCVSADNKWDELFSRCSLQLLGSISSYIDLSPTAELSHKVWSNIAAVLNNASSYILRPKRKQTKITFDAELQKIPDLNAATLTCESYSAIRLYLAKALEANIHPLSELLNSLVDAFLATYVGVGSHLRLLQHAVDELKSYINRLYGIIRFMFPSLPDSHHPAHIYLEATSQDVRGVSDNDSEIVTPATLLYAFMLPKVYPPLFNLYALYNEKDDDRYWKRIRLWNKQSNVALMAYLGVDRKFWLCNADQGTTEIVCQQKLIHGDDPFSEAIDRLQRISTSFSPGEKLSQIHLAFDEINKVVQIHLCYEYQWCMDDLFPVFQYIVVRSRIQHLAAEIHFIDDLMEPHLEHGELGIMFTTLKACYYQILNEKVV